MCYVWQVSVFGRNCNLRELRACFVHPKCGGTLKRAVCRCKRITNNGVTINKLQR